MAAKFRAGAVPLHPAPHHEAQGAPEALPGPAAGEGVLRRAAELQAGGRPAFRAVRQQPGLRAHHLQPAPGPRTF